MLTYLPNRRQRPAFRATPTQSSKIVSRLVNTKEFGSLGVDKGARPCINLWPSLLSATMQDATAISVSYEFPIIIDVRMTGEIGEPAFTLDSNIFQKRTAACQ
jgi:hypothetical protein